MGTIPTCVSCGAPALPGVGMPHSPDCVSYRGPVRLVFVRSEETAILPVGFGDALGLYRTLGGYWCMRAKEDIRD